MYVVVVYAGYVILRIDLRFERLNHDELKKKKYELKKLQQIRYQFPELFLIQKFY